MGQRHFCGIDGKGAAPRVFESQFLLRAHRVTLLSKKFSLRINRFSGTVFAQSAPPKVGNKSLVQVKPKEPMGCKLVGTVRGAKLWAGDCVASELRGSTTTTQTQALPEQATAVIPPGQKE